MASRLAHAALHSRRPPILSKDAPLTLKCAAVLTITFKTTYSRQCRAAEVHIVDMVIPEDIEEGRDIDEPIHGVEKEWRNDAEGYAC